MEKAFLAALQMTEKLGTAKISGLIHYFGSAHEAWQADRRALFFSGCLKDDEVDSLLALRRRIDPLAVYQAWTQQGIRLIAFGEDDYPPLLRQIYDPPSLLYVRGELVEYGLAIAVVGARKATPYGKQAANWLAGDLAAKGCNVISGAARGIDTAAHKGALAAGGTTTAVLGCGVDIAYPPENRELLRTIAERGAVLSEYPPGTPPLPFRFPARNRIINGLANGVVVVEAAERSGAMITVDYALAEGRDVFCIPGSIFSANSVGVNRLIQQGATLVMGGNDIMREYGESESAAAATETPMPALQGEDKQLWQALDREQPRSLDELSELTGLAVTEIFPALLRLELTGQVVRCDGQRFLRALSKEGT